MECKVRFIDSELKRSFEQLKISNPKLHKEIERAFLSICHDAFFGRRVKKELVPKELIKKYDIDNLLIYNLSEGWRLFYSITSDEIEVFAVILDWKNHKDYSRLFKF